MRRRKDTRRCASWLSGQLRFTALLQPLQPALALHDVLVVPLDVDRLLEPALEIHRRDLIRRGVAGAGGLEAALGSQTGLVERATAPEHQADAVFQSVVTDDRIAIQEPDRMSM